MDEFRAFLRVVAAVVCVLSVLAGFGATVLALIIDQGPPSGTAWLIGLVGLVGLVLIDHGAARGDWADPDEQSGAG